MPRLVAPGLALAVAGLLTAGLLPATSVTDASQRFASMQLAEPTVISSRVIGYSVNDHPIRAYEVGDPEADTTVVAIASMHGNETGGQTILQAIRKGPPVKGVLLWLIPRQNPDGVLRDRRHNAHGVDLNRNFPTKWKRLTGWYYSGPRHSSEPETRATKRFLNRVEPDYVVSFHSPLYGIDAYDAKDRRFARRLANEMNIPIKEFDCGGVCHGTLTQWFNKNFAGACVTVELKSSHRWRYLNVRAPRALVRAIGGHF
ncbi:MAG: M14 family zinc carboxypeptidase [Nocardioidaceae bacterium]